MNLDEYQKQALTTDLFGGKMQPLTSMAFIDKVLGLVGESGEVADKIKKIIRDQNGKMTDDQKQDISKELGDVLWYVAVMGEYLGVSMDEIAAKNLAKLADRQKRNTLSGSGDNR